MDRGRWIAGMVLAMLAALAAASPTHAGDEETLARKRADLAEAQAALAAQVDEGTRNAFEQARATVAELGPWVERFRTYPLMHAVGADAPVSIAKLEGAVERAEGSLEHWRRDDADKGQGEGPQTRIAKEQLAEARAALATFKAERIDPAVAKQTTLGGQGITTFDELDRRHREAQALIERVDAEHPEAKRLRRRVESLERDIARLEDRIRGETVYRLVHIQRTPRGDYERMVPEGSGPMGGTWERMRVTANAFHHRIHNVYHQTQIEDWTLDLSIERPPDTITVSHDREKPTILDLEAHGTCTVTTENIPDDRISGEGAQLDVRTEGAARRLDQGALRVNRKAPDERMTVRIRMTSGSAEAKISVFLWNTPMHILYVYERQ